MKPGIYPQTIGDFLLHSNWIEHTGPFAFYLNGNTPGFVLKADLDVGLRQVRGADREPRERGGETLSPAEAVIYSERTVPMLRDAPGVESDMNLPVGSTCADCVHFQRCSTIYGHIEADEVCDWAPSRFKERVKEREVANAAS